MQNVPRQRGPTISIRAKEKRRKRIVIYDIIKKWKNNNNKLQNGSIYPKEPAEKKKRKEKFPFIQKGKRNRTRKARIVTPTQENRKRKAPISREIIEVVRAAYLSSVRVRSSLPCRRSRSWRLLSRRATPTLVSRPT